MYFRNVTVDFEAVLCLDIFVDLIFMNSINYYHIRTWKFYLDILVILSRFSTTLSI